MKRPVIKSIQAKPIYKHRNLNYQAVLKAMSGSGTHKSKKGKGSYTRKPGRKGEGGRYG